MKNNTVYGGGYTCSACGKWNRSSIVCDHDGYLGLLKNPKLEERRETESFKKLKEHMEDRIEINGVWYVREDSSKPSNKEIPFDKEDITHTKSCAYETDKYCWEASIIVDVNDVPSCEVINNKVNYYLNIKFTDKTKTNESLEQEEYWDNICWFDGVLENNPESLEHINNMDEEGIKIFQKFLEYLKNDLGWF